MSGPLVKTAPSGKRLPPGIFRRGNRYVVVYRDPFTGRQKRKSLPTLAAARAFQAEIRADIGRGEYRSESRVTFAEYAPQWIESYTGRTRRGVGEATRANYRRALGVDADGELTGDGAIAFFGRRLLAEIQPRDLKRFASDVASRGVSHDTVRLALAPVKALLATAHEEGVIRSNPSAGLRNVIPVTARTDEEKVRALTEEELGGVLGEIPLRWRLFFEFLAESGLRIGEAVEVRFSDLDLGREELHVRRRFYRGAVDLPKGRKTRRVRLTSEMSRRLWALRKETRGTDDDHVFTNESGRRIQQPNLMTRVLKPAALRAGVGEWVGFHTFRHTCATVLFRSGWNASQVQLFLGHSDPGFTLRRYVHLLPADLPEPTVLARVAASGGANRVTTRAAETTRDDVVAVEAV
jgi:integrase